MEKFNDFIKKWINIILLVLVVMIFSLGYFFYNQFQNQIKELKKNRSEQDVTTKEAIQFKERLAQIAVVPDDDKKLSMLIANEDDEVRLNSADFFSQVKKGDFIMVYHGAKKAYLYRPSVDKIVDMGPAYYWLSPPQFSF